MMSQKERGEIGRNDPCPCGSGKKYKNCCYSTANVQTSIPDDVIKQMRKQMQDEHDRKQKYGEVRPIIALDFKDHKIVAAGNRVHWSKKWKTFPDFLMSYIASELGSDWGNAELKKPYEKRHIVLQWYDAVCRLQRTQDKGPDGLISVIPNGACAAYHTLAYDLYILRDHLKIKEEVIKRLKHPDQFQGARYELYVAATCIRAGYDIEYENEIDGSIKHTEFIATHRHSGQKISVEAKSQHRPGVLGYPGERKAEAKIGERIGRLIREALKKDYVCPLVVFIDINLPPDVARQYLGTPPPNKLSEILDGIEKDEQGRDKFNMIIFTNHPHHYGRDDEVDPEKAFLQIYSCNPRVMPKDAPSIIGIYTAASQYGQIPQEFPKDFN